MKKTIICMIIIIIILIISNIVLLNFKTTNEIIQNDIFYSAETIEEIEELKKEGKPIIIAFGADYCPTCVNYLPYIKELNSLYGDKIVIKYVDTVEHKAIRKEYNIELIPSTIFYHANGEVYKPTNELNVTCIEEPVEERKYISDTINIAEGTDLGLNDQFEYGVKENGELVYTKFVGLLDLVQLKQIVNQLIDSRF